MTQKKISAPKRAVCLFVFLIFFFCCGLLAGCTGVLYPETAEDGAAWDRSWEMLGTVLGVEAPEKNGFTLLENDSVLAGNDTYYAAWVAGDSSPYVNENGKSIDLYPAQIYLLLYGCLDGELAREAAADFLSREEENYQVNSEEEKTANGADYTVIHYDCVSESNPYERGVSAFGVWNRYVIVAELTATSEFQGDAAALLDDFLKGCHFSAEHLREFTKAAKAPG